MISINIPRNPIHRVQMGLTVLGFLSVIALACYAIGVAFYVLSIALRFMISSIVAFSTLYTDSPDILKLVIWLFFIVFMLPRIAKMFVSVWRS